MATLLLILARTLVALSLPALVVAAVSYSRAGQPLAPYLFVIPAWLALYVVMEHCLRRSIPRHPRLAAASAATVAAAGLAIAALSVGLAFRYAMTPEMLRQLGRHARSASLPFERSGHVRWYATGPEDAPRILFIHGTPGHAGVFASYLLDPPPGFECVAVDRPGFCGSDDCGPVPSFERQAAALAPLLVQRQGRWPIIVGHSLGGPIAARLAADYPDRVGGLVILAGSLDPALEAPEWYNLASSFPPISIKMPGLYETSNAEIAAAPEQTRLLAALLDRVTCPVRVIHGTADTLVPVQNADYIKRAMTHAASVDIVLIEGEGHAIHSRCAPAVRDAILAMSPAPAPK